MVSARVRASFFAYSSRPQSGRFAVFQNTFSPILSANEICATLAIAGFDSNMTAYLIKKLHMPATKAANTLTNFGGTARRFHYFSTGNGCFNTVSNTSTTTASPCKPHHVCQQADSGQLAMLYVTLVLTALGSVGIRPCVAAFG